MDRRNFLQLAALGLLAGAARNFLPAANAAGPRATATAKRCILLYMHGGPSQFDTFDPKPESKNGGGVRAIETSVSGLRISANLPLLAARMHELVLVRSLTAKEGNHDRARYLMHTGHPPQGGVVHPGLGTHASRTLGEDAMRLPAYVSIDSPGQAPGYLGAAHAPFVVPNAERPVRNLTPARTLDDDRRARRLAAWRTLEDGFAKTHADPRVGEHRAVSERAVEMIDAREVAAFDLSDERPETLERYGNTRFGRGCLMAKKLAHAGVPFIEVGLRGWDTHENNLEECAAACRSLDAGMSALVDDLQADGLWGETLLVWIGDFGRTPRLNARGGRDHFPDIGNVVLGGAGLEGRVHGATDPDGEEIVTDPVTVPDLFATLCARLGIPGDEMHATPSGRPVTTADPSGRVLFG